MVPSARFDDHTPGAERSFAFAGLQEAVVARQLDDVRPAMERVEAATRDGLWAAGFIAYEAAPAFDRALTVRMRHITDPFPHLPLVWFGLFARRESSAPFEARTVRPAPYHVSAWSPTVDPTEYARAIAVIRRHIADGDTYQVNHTFRLRAAFSGDPYELYRDLVLAQRGAFSAYFDVGRYRVLSASPEQFFRIDGDRISTRPMKGTIRRGRWPEEDRALADRLVHSEKDRAENLMIVDLIRNDLGRIAEFGTVRTDSLLELERYETLWQLTSTVGATLRAGTSLGSVMTALFPSGSVTGAPKARTMEIIADLEASPRGVYCGTVGYVAPPDSGQPSANFNVAIRTVVIDLEEGLAEYGVGGGITWDSAPEAEYEETRTKSLLLADRRTDFRLFETLRWEPVHGFWWLDEHLERLVASAGYFGFAFDEAGARLRLGSAVTGLDRPRRVRLVLDRSGEMAVDIGEEVLEPMIDGASGAQEPLRVELDDDPVSSQNVFLFHKTDVRRMYEERARRHPGVDDVVLCNERGEVTESTVANIVVRFGDEWWTPTLDSGCLPGVYRRVLLEKGAVKERSIAVLELRSASEIALVNSVRGWRPAVLVEA